MKLTQAVPVLFIAIALTAQVGAQTVEGSRNRGVTGERVDTRQAIPPEALAVPQAQQACDGANYTTNAFNNNIFMGGPLVAIAWTPTASLTITRIEVFTGESAGPAALAIWSDDSSVSPSKPLANLGNTNPFALAAANSWQGANLLTQVNVNAGTKYWVVFDPAGGEQAPVQNGTGQQYWGSNTGTVTSVPSSAWFGPFSSNDHAWKFRVFCAVAPIDVYAVKFLCGSFAPKPTTPPAEGPVKPGNYLTAINVHNPNHTPVSFRKKAVLLYRADKPPKPEEPMPPGKLFEASLREDWGLEIDCYDIRNVLLKGVAPPAPTFIKGWVVIELGPNTAQTQAPPLDVTAVYTSHGWDLSGNKLVPIGFAEDVESVLPKKVQP